VKRRRAFFTIALSTLSVVFAVATGCARSERAATPPACEPGAAPVVDSVLLAFLSKARSAHHKADVAEASGDRAVAITSLEGLTRGPRPGGAKPLPEVAEVLADTFARLADLRSEDGDYEAAMRDVNDGLALATATTYFRGHLFEVRGLVEERRGKALEAKGDELGASVARNAAIDAFGEAVKIQDEVISSALGDGGPR